ncbi:MAG TPA: hypothetical protein VHR65_03010 [Solirubrobacterales bacterium]|nr:hypothetical protein [Solirubrobacterales bacterium]
MQAEVTVRPGSWGREAVLSRLRDKILRGVAADYRSGSGVGPRRFGLCLRLGLRRALTGAQLDSLAAVYRRPSGRQFVAQALNRLAVPVGDSCGGRRFVPEMLAASTGFAKVNLSELRSPRPGVVYGPYMGVSCPRANSTRCDRVGFDLVLRRRAVAVAASVAGRSTDLISPGPVPHNAGAGGRDWGGYLDDVGLSREGSPFRIPANGRARGVWAGQPPVYLPVRLAVTYSGDHRVTFVFPRILLSPGFG